MTWERERRGWSYQGLASRMTAAGCAINQSGIYKLEKGEPRRRITVDELVAMAQVFDVPVALLLEPPETVTVPEMKRLVEQWQRAEADVEAAAGKADALRDQVERYYRVQSWSPLEVAPGADGWVRVGLDGGRILLSVRMAEDGTVGELHAAASGSSGIGVADLRTLPLARVRALALSQSGVQPERVASLTPPGARIDDTFLRLVAAAYLAAVARGERPNKALAEQVGHESSRTVERWVYVARKRGFLGPAPRGAVG